MKKKEPFFCNSYDAIGAYQQKRISSDSPLWLGWRLDLRLPWRSESQGVDYKACLPKTAWPPTCSYLQKIIFVQ